MATTINFEYSGKEYCLEFDRKTIKQMEGRGFVASRITEAPMSVLPDLFAGAFLKHHKFVKREVIDEIFNAMGNRRELIDTLAQMYNEPIEALMTDEPEEGNAIAWTKG